VSITRQQTSLLGILTIGVTMAQAVRLVVQEMPVHIQTHHTLSQVLITRMIYLHLVQHIVTRAGRIRILSVLNLVTIYSAQRGFVTKTLTISRGHFVANLVALRNSLNSR